MSLARGSIIDERRESAEYACEAASRVRVAKWQAGVKRALDVSGAASFLILFAPFLIALVALCLIMHGRPIFYGHLRVGRGGKPFRCYKFRTMVTNGHEVFARHLEADPLARREWETTFKLKEDPRVTALGRTLRKLSLDELPQFVNVLWGDMSLVGPRPVVERELEHYGPHAEAYVSVRPGITGLWQVSGRSDTSYEQRIRLDVAYVRDWSLAHDLVILARTIPAVLTASGSV